MRFCMYQDDDAQLDIEMVNHRPFVHLEVYKWSPRTARKFAQFQILLESSLYLGGARVIYAMFRPDQQQGMQFAKRFGFKPYSTLHNGNFILGKVIDAPIEMKE